MYTFTYIIYDQRTVFLFSPLYHSFISVCEIVHLSSRRVYFLFVSNFGLFSNPTF